MDAPKRRIDGGGLRREGLSPSIDDWLNEVDVNSFVTGGGPTESGASASQQEREIVQVFPYAPSRFGFFRSRHPVSLCSHGLTPLHQLGGGEL